MDKRYFSELVKLEVYNSYKVDKLSLIDKIWCKYYRPESNSVFLIRKYLYLSSLKGTFNLIRSRICLVKLMRRYNIYVSRGAKIGKGLRLIHPFGICITNAEIGENFTVFQNCTIGIKANEPVLRENAPKIGSGVNMYANSMIVGPVVVGDGVILGANSLLNTDADRGGYMWVRLLEGFDKYRKGFELDEIYI